MIPDFVDVGAPWRVLPPGIHDASMSDIEDRYATNERRRMLFEGLERALACLRRAGCKTVYLLSPVLLKDAM